MITGSGLNEKCQKLLFYATECAGSCKTNCISDTNIIAVDIGTTTIAMVLYDRQGQEKDCFVTVNPQVKYGADVLSRMQAAEEADVLEEMKRQVQEVLAEGIRRFRRKERELHMIIAANTTMIYLLLGLNPAELGRSPFKASHLGIQNISIEGVRGIVFPGLSAFVGADILSGIYACDMAQKEEITLLIDLGTNGEMAIGSSKGIIACSTAAGPAFEGGATKGIWGADMVHLTAELLRRGILDETGLMEEEYFEKGILIGNTLITQESIRRLQLAKAAIAAGIGILAEAYGLENIEQIDRVVLAGGFGYFLKASDAVEIGLLPDQMVSKVISGGNTALAGIRRYIMESRETAGPEAGYREETDRQLEKIIKVTKVINLAEQEAFQAKYIEAMNLKRWQVTEFTQEGMHIFE